MYQQQKKVNSNRKYFKPCKIFIGSHEYRRGGMGQKSSSPLLAPASRAAQLLLGESCLVLLPFNTDSQQHVLCSAGCRHLRSATAFSRYFWLRKASFPRALCVFFPLAYLVVCCQISGHTKHTRAQTDTTAHTKKELGSLWVVLFCTHAHLSGLKILGKVSSTRA